jgi:hypothetical protein
VEIRRKIPLDSKMLFIIVAIQEKPSKTLMHHGLSGKELAIFQAVWLKAQVIIPTTYSVQEHFEYIIVSLIDSEYCLEDAFSKLLNYESEWI